MRGEEQAGPRVPGPVAGLLVGAALGAAVFFLAALLHERLSSERGPGLPPEGFAAGGDPRAAVRFLATVPGPGVQALLLPLREDGRPTEAEEAVLDRALFPGGPAHRWARLLASNPRDAGGAFTLPLEGGALVLGTAAGPVRNEDLAAAFGARHASLPPHRDLDLRVARVPEREVEVPPGGTVRALVAFPREADLEGASGLEIRGGLRLVPKEATTEALRGALLDGRIADLPGEVRAEARPARGTTR